MELPHRLAMAPMTRSRSQEDGTPGELTSLYYAQRASVHQWDSLLRRVHNLLMMVKGTYGHLGFIRINILKDGKR
ncbi:hypothetical protein [Paenibacillus polymyxa]|uniref:hypothetical protein n=1 Tax=Paenibacillus polymyxa TaxID=1406 RepID=UPI0032AEE374